MDPKEALWRQGLFQARSLSFRALGSSMLPILCNRDIVTIVAGLDIRVGDIVLADHGGDLVLHRVVAKRNGLIFTKGDFLPHLDAPVEQEQILGRAVSRERQPLVRRLDHLGSRFLGLALSFTVALLPGLIPLLSRVKGGTGISWSGLVRR